MTPIFIITLFFTVFAAVLLANTLSLSLIAKRLSRKVGKGFVEGTREYVNEGEKKYTRKSI